MTVKAKYAHTNINAADWKKLSRFYQKVFDCKPVYPQRDLQGEWIEKVTDIDGVHIEGIHLALPGYEAGGPTLEIFSYNKPNQVGPLNINEYGFAHIAFEVEDVEKAFKNLLDEGGSAVGEMVTRHYPGVGILTLIYAKDPEGNIVELQKWT
ncbi:MAG: VOC family protein [Clostridia bacterium]|nr:VOC family protein [Clostridia bacterium]